MSEHAIELSWTRSEPDLRPGKFSNTHTIRFNSENELKVDAAPDWGGDANHANPEQALAAAISSCHMMTFLALAAKAQWPVASFEDRAVAHLGKNAKGQMSVTQIDLHPVIRFDAGFTVEEDKLEAMHQRAHRYCFIANTLAESVDINVM